MLNKVCRADRSNPSRLPQLQLEKLAHPIFHSSIVSIAMLLQAAAAGDTDRIHRAVPHFPNINHHFYLLSFSLLIFFSLGISMCPDSPAVLCLSSPPLLTFHCVSLQVSCPFRSPVAGPSFWLKFQAGPVSTAHSCLRCCRF